MDEQERQHHDVGDEPKQDRSNASPGDEDTYRYWGQNPVDWDDFETDFRDPE